MKSKIFDDYAKIAEEQGLISEAYPIEKRLSRPISDIELLYGIKPNGKEDDTDMVDKAHPEPAVISPAHDKFNGVVENIKERQSVMTYIALKPNNGNYWQERFVTASDDLKMNLIRLGFKYDNEDNEPMMKLADQCVGKIHKKAVLITGTTALIIGGIAAAILGYTALVNQLSPISQGLVNDTENAIEELKEANEDVYPNTQSEINTLLSSLNSFLRIAKAYLNSGGVGLDPETATIEEIEKARKSDAVMSKLRLGRQYITAIRQLKSYLPTAINVLKSSSNKESNWSSFLAPFVKAYRFFDPNDLDDAYLSLETLVETLKKEESRVQTVLNQGPSHAIGLAVRMREQADAAQGDVASTVSKPVETEEVSTPAPSGVISDLVRGK